MKLKEGDLVEFRATEKGKVYYGYILGFISGKYHIRHILKKQFYLVEPKDVYLCTNLYRRNK